jgi:hypothetical protein
MLCFVSCTTYNTVGTSCVKNKHAWTRAQSYFSQLLPSHRFIYQSNSIIRVFDYYDGSRWLLTKEGDSFCVYHYQNKPQIISPDRQTDGMKNVWMYIVNDPNDKQLHKLLEYINMEK